MPLTRLFSTICLGLALILTGCKNDTASLPTPMTETSPTNEAAVTPAAPAQGFAGKVVETMNSGGYTYVQVDTGQQTIWAAAPVFKVKVGEPVVVPPGMPMPNFHSSTLDRDFKLIYFVNAITAGNAQPQAIDPTKLPKGHPPISGAAGQPHLQAPAPVSGIKKAEGGQTIAEIFAGKADLKGKTVKVRGKVMKFNANIMGKNWLHLQDGTGAAGSSDLTVTTSAQAKVGDTVVVTGTLVTDKDFGYNYQYPVMIEKASVVTE